MENNFKKIIIVNDDIASLNIIRNDFGEYYDVIAVRSGEELFRILENATPDLILLDMGIPGTNSYEILKKLKDSRTTVNIPVIFLSPANDPQNELKSLSLGAADYITKPFSQQLLFKRIELHLTVASQKNEIHRYKANLNQMAEEKRKSVFEMQNAILKTVAELVECRNNIMAGHIERTQNYLKYFMEILAADHFYSKELLSWDIDLFVMASELHDIGKISIKDSILMKPGKLTPEEFEEIKKHTVFGVNIIRKIESRTTKNLFLQYAKILAGNHHEKWDGTGYPLGLKGEEIPLPGRLMAIVDVYDTLTNIHPYKNAYIHEEAIKIIKNGAGLHFDPILNGIFIDHEKDFKNIIMTHNPFKSESYNSYLFVDDLQYSISKTVSNIVDIRSNSQDEPAESTEQKQQYLEIFTDILSQDSRYRDEIASWDVHIFILAAQLHDIGKIAVKDHILNKTDKLTDEEYRDIKLHTDFGIKVVNRIKENVNEEDNKMLIHAEVLAGSHHEKWDGTGYPLGLKGEEIPLQARLMAIIDVYNALTSYRPYRVKMTHEKALDIIKSYAGTYFDPDLVNIFIEHEKEFLK